MEKGYNQDEIDNAVNELLTIHAGKLKEPEREFLESIQGKVIGQGTRVTLLKLYDAIGEAGY